MHSPALRPRIPDRATVRKRRRMMISLLRNVLQSTHPPEEQTGGEVRTTRTTPIDRKKKVRR
jgi:hypothetical protein